MYNALRIECFFPVNSPNNAPVMQNLGVSLLVMNSLLKKQLNCWWFEAHTCTTRRRLAWLCLNGSITQFIIAQ